MAYLIAGSDGPVTFTCSEVPDTYAVTLTDAAGVAVTTAAETLLSATVTALVSAADIPTSAIGETWQAVIVWTKGGQTRRDVMWLDIREDDGGLLPALKAELKVEDTTDDVRFRAWLMQAEAAIGARFALSTYPVATQSRVIFADGRLVHLAECVTVTAVTDLDSTALTYTAVGSVDSLLLDSAYTGYIIVTGTWGFDDIPADEKRAIVIQAAVYYRRGTYGTDDAPYRGGGAALAPEVEQLMAARRVV